jgi:hypothetical protein
MDLSALFLSRVQLAFGETSDSGADRVRGQISSPRHFIGPFCQTPVFPDRAPMPGKFGITHDILSGPSRGQVSDASIS